MAGAARTTPLRLLCVALSFLTRMPSPRWVGHDAGDLARSMPYFPAVGIIVGAWAGALYAGARALWPAPVAVTLAIVGAIWATGALHEDALADVADGFGGGWTREQVLTIMKDSRVGSYGALALVVTIAARLVALLAIADAGTGAVVRTLIAAHALARWSSLPLLWRHSYARAEGGTGSAFANDVTPARVAGGSAVAFAAAGITLRGRALIAVPVAMLLVWLSGRFYRRRIGGVTGDCLGATVVLVEVATYLVAAAHLDVIGVHLAW
ncbi:MAG: adenosylcobinamide-GDP ribazoletransferase [Gemmatimonadaceae bacterium]|nr:adenosylcobinamide-GDP ribazoletransferase [Gemmatimonadaceae bacterium]